MTYDFSQMKMCEVLPGFWYDAALKTDPTMYSQIKLTKDNFFDVNGWQIMARCDKGNSVTIFHAHTFEECRDYVKETFIWGRPYNSLRKELTEDYEFLKKDCHSRSWEIAQHIDYILNHIIGD